MEILLKKWIPVVNDGADVISCCSEEMYGGELKYSCGGRLND
jgi:hypothetical protein